MRFGADESVPRALEQALCAYRRAVLDGARAGRTMRAIAHGIADDIAARGLANCHRKHIGAVLGHRVSRERGAFLRGRQVWGLAPRQAGWFLVDTLRSRYLGPRHTPNWNHSRACDCPVADGLWAIEPHVASGAQGAKFEELLVVQDGTAWYLDDGALPHHRRWQASGVH